MSKTTQKYGKPLFVARLTTDTPAKPSKKLLRQWARLDDAAMKKYDKKYDALTDKEKVALHYELNVAREQARNKQMEEALSEPEYAGV